MSTLPIPQALYSCKHCAAEHSWPAGDLFWSRKILAWVCGECWDDDAEGEIGISLEERLKESPATAACSDAFDLVQLRERVSNELALAKKAFKDSDNTNSAKYHGGECAAYTQVLMWIDEQEPGKTL